MAAEALGDRCAVSRVGRQPFRLQAEASARPHLAMKRLAASLGSFRAWRAVGDVGFPASRSDRALVAHRGPNANLAQRAAYRAILDHALRPTHALKERNIPIVTYSGYDEPLQALRIGKSPREENR